MGVPQRFVTEYPKRCLDLIEILDQPAHELDLLGSFSLLIAGSVLTIPYERLQRRHFLFHGHDQVLSAASKGLGKVNFPDAPFWNGNGPKDWGQSRVMANVSEPNKWLDEDKCHPMCKGARNTLDTHSAAEVLRVIRNALAHGNVVYLNENGLEIPGDRMHFLAFLSRYEEEAVDNPTFRIVSAPEMEFLRFVKCWATWISRLAD